MPAQVKHLIMPSGGDYTSASAWEAGEQRDLVAADEIALGEITGDWSGGADTTYLLIDNVNWTTDATHYISLYTAEDARHPGRWDTNKYVLSVSSQWNGVVRVDANYVRIDGLQIENVWTDATTGNVVGINQNGHGDEHTNNIIRWGGGGTPDSASDAGIQYDGAAAGTHKARNNIIYDWYMGMYFDYGAAGTTFVLYDNTINDNVSTGIWIQDSVGDVTLYMKNNICNGNGAADYNETTFTTYVHSKNISEDATSPDASYQSMAVVFVDEANDDFHVDVSDTYARGAGDDLSADAQMAFNDDIDGFMREVAWDIGADQFRAVEVKRSILESGGDYSSLSGFAAGEERDLGHLGEIAVGEIDEGWTSADTGYTDFAPTNWVTTRGNYISVFTTKAARHPGRWDTSKYRLVTTNVWYGAIRCRVPFVRIDGLQVSRESDVDVGDGTGIRFDGSGDYHVTNNIVRFNGTGTLAGGDIGLNFDTVTGGNFNAYVRNNIVYDFYYGFLIDWAAGGNKIVLYNNTFHNNVGRAVQIVGAVGDIALYMKDNIAQGSGLADYNITSFTTLVTSKNISEDTTSPDGASYQSKVVTFVDEAGDDFHVAAADTSGALKGGDNLSADAQMAFTDDVDGHARSSGPWTIGADEYRSVEVIRTISETGGDYTSTAAFEAAEQRDLVNLGEAAVAKIDGAWAAADTGSAYFDSADWVTAEGNGIKVYTTAVARHKGRPGTTTYRINPAAVGGIGIRTGVPWTEIYGVEILDWGGSGYSASAIQVNTGISNCRIGYNLIHNEVAGNGGAGISFGSAGSYGMHVFNNIIYGCQTGISGDSWGTSFYQYVYANTVSNMSAYGIVSNNGFTVAKDNLVQTCATACYNSNFAAASTNNLADDTTAPGSSPINSTTVSFININGIATNVLRDYRIHEDSANARGAGADLTSDADLAVADDINGKPRDPLHFDVGASQFVAVERERVIADSGGDYTTQAAFEAGEQTDLVAEGVALVGKISGSFAAAETTTVTYAGSSWYTCRGNGLKVYTLDDGARHPGRWSDTAYRIIVTANECIRLESPVRHIWIDGQQLFTNHSTSPYDGVHSSVNDSSSHPEALIEVSNNIMKSDGTAGGKCGGFHSEWAYGYNTANRIWKNIIYDFGNGGGYKESGIMCRTGDFWVYRNTIDRCRYGVYDDGNGADITAKGNIALVYGTTPVCYQGTFNANSTNNLASDATAPGSNPINNATPVFVDQANDDYHLDMTDTDAMQAGLDLSADAEIPITDDIDGHGLKAVPDVGADEYRELEVKVRVRPTGGDYTTLAAANTGEERDLVHAGEKSFISVEGDWSGGPDTTDTTFDEDSAWRTSAGNYVRIEADDANRATAKWDANKYVRRVAGISGVINIDLNRCIVRGLQLHANNAYRSCVQVHRSGGHVTVDGNFCRALDQTQNCQVIGLDGYPMTVDIINNICEGGGHGIFSAAVVEKDLQIYNNTIYDMSQVGVNVNWSTGVVNIKNNLVQVTAVNDYVIGVSGGTLNTAGNVSEDATSPETALRNLTAVFEDVGSLDFHLSTADSAGRLNGTDLSADAYYAFDTDINVQKRIAPWDSGAAELLLKTGGGGGGMFNRGMV